MFKMKSKLISSCFVLFVFLQAGFADKENTSQKISPTPPILNETWSLMSPDYQQQSEEGPPDSHEAMNNPRIRADTLPDKGGPRRVKRSYEFLMGLINNNSNFELTRADTVGNNAPKRNISKDRKIDLGDMEASELLLELMIKIASNPQQWEKVHQLLGHINTDLQKSKQLLQNYASLEKDEVKKSSLKTDLKIDNKININKEIAISSDNKPFEVPDQKWPDFPEENAVTSKYPWPTTTTPEYKNSYLKNFAYHRVTAKPVLVNKKPKAYIAVSVIAPKREENYDLENELKHLKPWSHEQNLKNMENLRQAFYIPKEKNNDLP